MSSQLLSHKEIFNILSSAPGVKATSNIQLQTKCFLCGDSAKNPNKKRLGIKINIYDPKSPIQYNCFNCHASGLLTVDMVHEMGLDNKDLDYTIKYLNHNATKDDGSRVNHYKNNKEIQIQFPPLLNTKRTISKIKYLYDRVGYKIPIEDFNKLKIVFNLDEFLQVNQIHPVNEHTKILSDDYIGFLSVNNEYIIFRDITNSHKMRYIKYNVFGIIDNTNSFYAMKNSLDLLTTDDIHIVIAEGAFDVISVRYNIFHNDMTNKICLASCNGSFMNPIMYYIKKGIVGSNIKIDCYQDNDTLLNFRNIRSKLKPYIITNTNFSVYYNRLYKDFGVSSDNIELDKLNI